MLLLSYLLNSLPRIYLYNKTAFSKNIPDPTSTSGFPSVTAEVKSSPRYSMSHCQFTNLCCCVYNTQFSRVKPAKMITSKSCSIYLSTHLDGYFGAHSSRELVDDLGIQTASIIHISNHDWEWLKEAKHISVSFQVVWMDNSWNFAICIKRQLREMLQSFRLFSFLLYQWKC